MNKLACLFLVLAASGCPNVETDPGETGMVPPDTRPIVEFDPSNKIVPFPNNLLLDPSTGKVNLPAQCMEPAAAKALREGVLNQLDGFGLFESALNATFSAGIDATSLEGRIVIYKRATGTTPVDPATAMPLPVVTQLATAIRFDANCANPTGVAQLVIIPRVALEQKSTYVVALLSGIKTGTGTDFEPSGTWRLVRGERNPVTVDEAGNIIADATPLDPGDEADRARLLGIDLLWKAHAGGLKFLTADLPADKRKGRGDILLAWEFRTQTATDQLDPTVAGSPAASVNTMGLQDVATRTGTVSGGPAGETGAQFLARVLPAGACTLLPCNAVGDVLAGKLVSKSYQPELPNPVAGTCTSPDFLGCPLRGQWSDPVKPTMVKNDTIETLVVTPAAACPAAGCPTVIFAHRLVQGKTGSFQAGPVLAAQGFATVAIDAVAHDSRAIRISNDAARGCGGARPSPITAPQCFAPFLSPSLGATRDNIRQTILDYHGLLAALKACNATPCGGFKPDLTKIYFVGQSIGGHMGGVAVATSADVKSAVLNVAGVGWVGILENTQSLPIRCQLVDGLIDAGILQGEKSNLLAMPPTGLCTTDAWKSQVGYRQFSVIARWVVDPADPANFTRKLAARRFLIQQVDDDKTVPNANSAAMGALTGLTAMTADPLLQLPPPAPTASAAITTNPMTNKYVRYPTTAQNSFEHGSLLIPAPSGNSGVLGTLRMQTDAVTFLKLNP